LVAVLALRAQRCPGQGMQPLAVERQTDQTPFPCGSCSASQRELPEPQHLLHDPDDRFDGAFAGTVDRFSQCRLESVGHLDRWAGVCWWERRLVRETFLPTRVLGIASSSDVRLDAPLCQRLPCCRSKVACVPRRCGRGAECRRNRGQGGFHFRMVIGMIGEGGINDQQAPVIDRHLAVGVRQIFEAQTACLVVAGLAMEWVVSRQGWARVGVPSTTKGGC